MFPGWPAGLAPIRQGHDRGPPQTPDPEPEAGRPGHASPRAPASDPSEGGPTGEAPTRAPALPRAQARRTPRPRLEVQALRRLLRSAGGRSGRGGDPLPQLQRPAGDRRRLPPDAASVPATRPSHAPLRPLRRPRLSKPPHPAPRGAPPQGSNGAVIPPPSGGGGPRSGPGGLSAAQQAPSPSCAGSSPAGEQLSIYNSSTFRGRWTAQRAGGGQRRLSKPPRRAPPGAPPQGSHQDTGIAIVSSRVLRNEASLRARHVDGRDPTIWMRQTQIRPSLRQTAFPRGPPCPSVDSPPS